MRQETPGSRRQVRAEVTHLLWAEPLLQPWTIRPQTRCPPHPSPHRVENSGARRGQPGDTVRKAAATGSSGNVGSRAASSS